MSDEKETREDPRTVPADQRSQGPNETIMVSSEALAGSGASARSGDKVRIEGTPRLVGRSPVVRGQSHELSGDKITIGRAETNDVVIEDATVSARHAQIVVEDGVWRVVNLISTNGTAVNGQTAIVGYLRPGDVLRFGQVEMVLEVDAPEERRSGIRQQQSTDRAGPGTTTWIGVAVGVVALLVLGVLLL